VLRRRTRAGVWWAQTCRSSDTLESPSDVAVTRALYVLAAPLPPKGHNTSTKGGWNAYPVVQSSAT